MNKKELAQLKTLMPVLIKKHVWERCGNEPWWGERCKYCTSYSGIGTGSEGIVECNLRFNEDKFQDYIKFNNYSKAPLDVIDRSNAIKYYKRFSRITLTEQNLIVNFCKSFDIKGVEGKMKLLKKLRKN